MNNLPALEEAFHQRIWQTFLKCQGTLLLPPCERTPWEGESECAGASRQGGVLGCGESDRETTAQALRALGKKRISGRKMPERRLLQLWLVNSFHIRQFHEESPYSSERKPSREKLVRNFPARGPTHSCLVRHLPPCLQIQEAVYTSR